MLIARRTASVVLIVAASCLTVATPCFADDPPASPDIGADASGVEVSEDYRRRPDGPSDSHRPVYQTPKERCDHRRPQLCPFAALVRPGGDTALADLVLEAQSRIDFPLPRLEMRPRLRSPDGAVGGIVGVPVWFWMDASRWRPLRARAQAGPVWVEVTATPYSLSIFPGGDEAAFSCAGPGTPLADLQRALDGSPDCGHTYRRDSADQPNRRYRVTIAVLWQITWVGAGDTAGFLEPVAVQTTFDYAVREARVEIAE
jgi:hypothetical protein